MAIAKKLILAPLFLIVFALLVSQLSPFLKSYDFIFSLSINTLITLLVLSFYVLISCFLFVLFATLAQNFKIILPIAFLSALIPLLFLESALALVLAVAIFVSFLLTFLSLANSLKSYLTFKPEALLGPAIRSLAGFLIAAVCLVYFLSANKIVAEKGFQIPDSLIDTALQLSTSSLPSVQPEQASLSQDLIKQTVKDQIQTFIKPYINFIPAGLALLLFLTLQSLTSILNLLIYPLLWITFAILERTGFVKFEVEQRPVKKLVV
ncbi:hypothetical protein HYU45_00380 [Candidatus Daviesbacteria bacterium]|nr:hypothetical protein [Candidatus Daviesbacteria bacterium]